MTGLPFGIFMGLLFGLQSGVRSGVFRGMVSGILFGVAIAAIVRSQENKAKNSPASFFDEELLKEGRASHVTQSKGIPGRMYLTNRQLFFEACPVNTEVYQLSISVQQISEAMKEKSLGVLSNQLHVLLSSGGKEKFLIDNVSDWINEITILRKNYLEEPRTEEMRLFR